MRNIIVTEISHSNCLFIITFLPWVGEGGSYFIILYTYTHPRAYNYNNIFPSRSVPNSIK